MARRRRPRKSVGEPLREDAKLRSRRLPPRQATVAGLLLLAMALAGVGAITWLAHWQAEDARKAVPYVLLHLGLFGVFLAALQWLKTSPWTGRQKVLIVLASAALFRLVLLPAPPLLDDDIYRYRWDGKLVANGVNPYAFTPESPELAAMREGDTFYARMGFRDIPTVYPPVSQWLFALGYWLNPNGLFGLKALIALFDLCGILALMGLLRALGRPSEDAALYAWCPLVLKEFGNSGHHDAVGIALLVAALWALAAGRQAASGALWALSGLVKPVAFQLLPGIAGRLRWSGLAITAALTAAAFAPFAEVGPARLWAGMDLYLRHWEKNDSLFALLQWALGGPVATTTPGFTAETHPTARAISLAVWAGVAFWALGQAWRERRLRESREGVQALERSIRRVAILLAVMLLVTPTMNPWYLAWIVPFLCIHRWNSWLLLTGTCGLSYLYDWQGRDLWWIRPLEYGPFFFVLLAEAWLARARSTRTASRA